MPRDLDKETLDVLREHGYNVDTLRKTSLPKDAPVTASAGIPGLLVYEDPSIKGTDIGGYVTPRFSPVDAMFLQSDLSKKDVQENIAHEAEHLLARRQLGYGYKINNLFDEMTGNTKHRAQFVQDASKVAPYLEKKYGISSAYLDPKFLEAQGTEIAPLVLFEQLATLASFEQTQGIDLTKDPYLRDNLFKDRKIREAYNALTGLRQTRLDAKDLPPHTVQKEKNAGILSDLREKLKSKKFKKGGSVDAPLPGNHKFI
jgi:hypothetical protein